MKKRILITGSTGMLGSEMVDYFLKKVDNEVFGISNSSDNLHIKNRNFKISLTNENDVKAVIAQVRPDIIVNCAANVNLEFCENNTESAFNINADAVSILLKYSENIKFVQMSTDSVFDGINGNYTENDEPHPLNEYSKSKLEAEKIILRERPVTSIIIRGNIYGFHVPEIKSSLFEWYISNADSGKKLTGYDNVIFNPLYTGQLVRVIDELIKLDYAGVINAGCDDIISKFNFLLLLKKEFQKTNLIEPGFLSPDSGKIHRPLNTSLNISKLKGMINNDLFLVSGIQELRHNYMIKYNIQ